MEKSSDAEADSSTLLYPPASFKMVDTCAGEFAAETPYFYSTSCEPDGSIGENEAEAYLEEMHS